MDDWTPTSGAIGGSTTRARSACIDEAHQVEEFAFLSLKMHFNAFGAEGEPLRDADPSLLDRASNLHPIAPSMANLNLNRYVPRALRQVSEVLTAPAAPSA